MVVGVDVLRWNGNIEYDVDGDGDGDLDDADDSENRRCSSDLMETRWSEYSMVVLIVMMTQKSGVIQKIVLVLQR